MDSQLSGGFLKHTLSSPMTFKPYSFQLPNGLDIIHHDVGVLEVSPENANRAIVISSGIHGDETAPIELVDDLVSEILNGAWVPQSRTLFIIAHPDAIHAHTRFIEENLNRLFADVNADRNAECQLANHLQEHVRRFFVNTKDNDEKWHFDMHSAIRDSKHYMFAVVPASTKTTDVRPLIGFLKSAQMDAMLLSRTPSSTFSWWSGENFGALAATFEMGRVAPLYQNDMSEFAPLKQALINFLCDCENVEAAIEHDLSIYKVTRTITKTDDAFSLAFSGDAANFTYFKEGEQLAEENGTLYVAQKGGEAAVFPNANVAVGQRACLLVTPFVPDESKPLFVNVGSEPGPIAIS
ncbi:succinylglutamate desuccinylase [Enterovibrio norvegicus FF-33]|uniref:Succinylglutamate desuccinylase n=1 Tax=Enterovibrio norvegicus FF-454 TaxID=1185651 RepID=A0A1E5C9D8_9GAMM|nr:succinylglutamate desuccinylase [Enterovibrio norvegicus]OEE62133.1 succinylglutamate desuccinylase [Enterovibrio norvegicus FF-454]OEE65719.1 succinylglutamate desuccinylase [Enterovibrio norvegicus FF-33]OEE90115.1 succinylglutamate desuccinylase [Enterovibrio norvegicus FF-162]